MGCCEKSCFFGDFLGPCNFSPCIGTPPHSDTFISSGSASYSEKVPDNRCNSKNWMCYDKFCQISKSCQIENRRFHHEGVLCGLSDLDIRSFRAETNLDRLCPRQKVDSKNFRFWFFFNQKVEWFRWNQEGDLFPRIPLRNHLPAYKTQWKHPPRRTFSRGTRSRSQIWAQIKGIGLNGKIKKGHLFTKSVPKY